MAREPRLVGESLLGVGPSTQRPPNTYSFFTYLAIGFVLVLGLIYAAPNLFQPDPALQLKAPNGEDRVTADQLARAVDALTGAGIVIKASDLTDDGAALIRLTADDDQYRGRKGVDEALNDGRAEPLIVALNRAPTTPAWLAGMGAKPMALGLDLSGGVHFLLQVDMDKFLSDRMASTQDALLDLFRENRVRYAGRNWVRGTELQIAFQSTDYRDQAQTLIAEELDGFLIRTQDVGARPGLRVSLTEEKIAELEDFAITQNLTSLKNRVNELGVSEPLVQRLGRSRIVVDLPGLQDPAEAKKIINKFANLDFRLVAAQDARASQTETMEYEGRVVTLERANIVTGDQVTNAVQNFDPETQQPQVAITLDADGGRRMNEVTQRNVGNQMAIIFKEQLPRTRTETVDGKDIVVNYTVEQRRLISVATIQSALGFNFRITGLSLTEARDLALLLRAGALAAPMYIVEERTVGASLGEANISQGTSAVAIGFALVLVFMLIYYRWFGLAANVALAFNLVLIAAVMSLLGATLTMPGIA
ncbi:MAG: protein translocase subunit SecD, partial [Pseudomonadota bacterium]